VAIVHVILFTNNTAVLLLLLPIKSRIWPIPLSSTIETPIIPMRSIGGANKNLVNAIRTENLFWPHFVRSVARGKRLAAHVHTSPSWPVARRYMLLLREARTLEEKLPQTQRRQVESDVLRQRCDTRFLYTPIVLVLQHRGTLLRSANMCL